MMAWLILGLLLFLGIHSVSIVAPGWRDAQVARLGERAWKGVYSVVSIVAFVVLVVGYGMARQSAPVLYTPPTGMRHVTLLLMLPVFPLIVSAYFPGRIQAALQHPFLLGVMLWALAHLLANGTLADLLLFGGFLAWAIADRISVARRPARPLPGAPRRPVNDVIAIVIGLAVYAFFVLRGHLWLIGVPLIG
jgi:uncharacterized membrane protein